MTLEPTRGSGHCGTSPFQGGTSALASPSLCLFDFWSSWSSCSCFPRYVHADSQGHHCSSSSQGQKIEKPCLKMWIQLCKETSWVTLKTSSGVAPWDPWASCNTHAVMFISWALSPLRNPLIFNKESTANSSPMLFKAILFFQSVGPCFFGAEWLDWVISSRFAHQSKAQAEIFKFRLNGNI